MALGDGDVSITGELIAGNMARGVVTITPVANTPTSISVSGLSLANNGGDVVGLAFPATSVPGETVIEVTTSDHTTSGMTIYIYRENTTDTNLYWHMFSS